MQCNIPYWDITVFATGVTKEEQSGDSFGQFWAFKLTVFVYSSLIYCHHDRIGIDTNIEVIVVSLTTWETHHWWASQVVNETTMTSILVSIPIFYDIILKVYLRRPINVW